MIKNYLLIAFRAYWKNKGFTSINLVGLAVGMSVCFMVILLVFDQVNYDEFHPDKERIYRILSIEKGASDFFDARASSSALFKEYLFEKETGIEQWTCMSRYFRGEARSEERILEFRGFYADPDFFHVFGFELDGISAEYALGEPFSVVLSEEFAARIFPNSDPVGQLIEVNESQEYLVRGIVKEPIGKTHVQFDMLGSFSSIDPLIGKKVLGKGAYQWENVSMAHNYMVLKSGTEPSYVEEKLNQLAEEHMDFPDDRPGYRFELQHLNNITPGRIMANELGFTMPLIFLGFFLLLGLIVILTATINYSNLAIAQALNRIKEVGIRKVNGATRLSIIAQFLVEALLINFGAMLLAIILYRLMIILFNGLWLFDLVGLELDDHGSAYLYFFLFSLMLGLITGIGPALYVSRFDPSHSLKQGFSPKSGRAQRWYSFSGKKFMIGFQFFLALILIISITLIRDQSQQLVNSQYGFEEENIFFIELQGHDPDLVRTEFEKHSAVLSTALTSHHTAVGRTMGSRLQNHPESEKVDFNFFSIDENYLDLMGISLIAGRDLLPPGTSSQGDAILINETAVEALGFEDAQKCIGSMVYRNDTTRLKIVGVVKDYNYEVLMKDIYPLMLIWEADEIEYLYLKLHGVEVGRTKEELEAIWKSFDERRDFKAGFLDEEMDMFYAVFGDLIKILTLIAALAVVITCLGLIGMVDFATRVRIKEVGVRKVLGAENRNLIWILSREFIILILITISLATPLALFLNSLWLDQMANHIDFTIANTLPGIFLILLISMGVIFWKTILASRSNPVLLLRNE